ncbi:Neopullulanase [compost metagenome]
MLKHGSKSRYADWFHITSFGDGQGDQPSYETFAFVPEMPKLNTTNPEVKEYLLKVSKYWIEEFDIDGWRLDVANEIDHKFWRQFRNTVRSVKDDLYIVAEVWNDAMPWLQGDQFDAVMNYPFTEAVIDFVAKRKIGAEKFANEVISHLELYPDNVTEVLFNLLGSHDTARILTECQDDKGRLKLAFLLLLTYPGSPSIYYGDEIGLTGDGDDFAYYRKCMEWEEEKQDQDLLSFMKRLIKIRKTYSAFTDNARFGLLEANNDSGLLVFTRGQGAQQMIVAINNGEAPVNVIVPATYNNSTIRDAWSESNEVLGQKALSFTLEPQQFRIYSVES